MEDDDPKFTYQPSAAWSNDPPHLGSFSSGSGQLVRQFICSSTSNPGYSSTTSQGASVNLEFNVGRFFNSSSALANLVAG